MPSKQSRARHAAPRDPSRTRAVLPGVLLAAAGTAFAGLAVMPTAAAQNAPRVSAAQALAPVELAPVALPPIRAAAAPPANLELMSALQRGSDIANTPPPPAPVEPPAKVPARTPARASRDRTPEEAAPTDGAEYVRPGLGRQTSGYGRRWGRLHAGVDLAAGTGSRISAVTNGTVLSAGSEGGYGNCVRILHGDGTVSLYGHMSAILVKKGQKVTAGQQIGREGNTGQSTGPHLHFEIRINDVPVNPVPWLTRKGVTV